MNALIVGLSGKKRSGKGVAATALGYSLHAPSVAFADAVKETVMAAFGWTADEVLDEGRRHEVDPYWGVSPAEMFQPVGTEMFRDHMQDLAHRGLVPMSFADTRFWIRRLERDLISMSERHKVIVVRDVRFFNELTAVLSDWKGVAYRIERPYEDRLAAEVLSNDTRPAGHSSETEMDHYSHLFTSTVHNDGTKEKLSKQITELVENELRVRSNRARFGGP